MCLCGRTCRCMLVISVISVLRQKMFKLQSSSSAAEITELISNLAEVELLRGVRGGEEAFGERVQGWRMEGGMEGGKTKKRDSYYRAGCRGRLFSPSSLCGRKTTIGRIGRESELDPAHKTPDKPQHIASECDYFNLEESRGKTLGSSCPENILKPCNIVQDHVPSVRCTVRKADAKSQSFHLCLNKQLRYDVFF